MLVLLLLACCQVPLAVEAAIDPLAGNQICCTCRCLPSIQCCCHAHPCHSSAANSDILLMVSGILHAGMLGCCRRWHASLLVCRPRSHRGHLCLQPMCTGQAGSCHASLFSCYRCCRQAVMTCCQCSPLCPVVDVMQVSVAPDYVPDRMAAVPAHILT